MCVVDVPMDSEREGKDTTPPSDRPARCRNNAENKKAVLRFIIDRRVLDDETLTLQPSYLELTEINMASPRGVEPLSPP